MTCKTTIIFFIFYFHMRALVARLYVKMTIWLITFSNLLKWRTLSDYWFQLNWLSKNLLLLCWLLLLSSFSRVRLNVISYIIILNKIVFLILNIFLMIKSLFFNTEINLIKNNIILWYSLKKDNSLFISFKWILKTLTFWSIFWWVVSNFL